MFFSRVGHTATLLPNGKVLVAGGCAGTKYAEIFDPGNNQWSITTQMQADRLEHTATLLPSGQVLVTGGYDVYGNALLNSAELYDWTADAWTSTTHPMNSPRDYHTATLLPDGRVLVAGGFDNGDGIKSSEVYNPADGTWTSTLPMLEGRAYHTATLLRDGLVLAVGYRDRAELFVPWNDNWGYAAAGGTLNQRSKHTASLLGNGQVLVAGGYTGSILTSAILYDPFTYTWADTGSLKSPRFDHTATVLANGQVLVTGGAAWASNQYPGGYYTTNTAELYEPAPPPKVSLPPLLAFYPFEGNAQDASGNGRHGTLSSPHSPTKVVGYQGFAYYFNGGADYITIPLDINPSSYPQLTMGAWAKVHSSGSMQPLLTHDDGAYDRQVGIDYRGGDYNWSVGWSAFCGSGGVLGAVPDIYDKWVFVAVVYDQYAGTVRLQVDDMVLTKSGVTLGQGKNQMYIGASLNPPLWSDYFDGLIDNVFVFGGALTDQQLAYIRNYGAPAILTAKRRDTASLLELLLLN